ncbi:AAA family ATPase [Nonomuraea sp. NPDC003804]|uniref:helix-turn-helix transcriptional regulator n=1 Tax=Nonomuraea sp. NPDC003804 TaxID=3154547 RepID=UPI0033BD27B2
MTATELFGRDVELERIDRFLDLVRLRGESRLVRGEPGVGKSALLDVTAEHAVAAGMRVLRASGSEFEADVSYSCLNQLLLPAQDDLERLPPSQREALQVALGFGTGPPPEPLLVCNAALALAMAVADREPALLLIDDVQWVDRASAVALGFIARRVAGRAVGLVAASRTGTESFLDRRGLVEVVIQPLGREASARLVDARFPELPGYVRRRVLDLARGNPLALIELPTCVTGAGPGGMDGSDVVPLNERLQAVFAARIADLPEATQRLLLVATLEGSGDLRLLREVAGEQHGLTDLAPAERARLVRVEDASARIVFRHPLIGSAIVDLSTHEARRDAHLSIAAALRGDPERQAWHLAAAAAGPDESVAVLLDEAARHVMLRGDALGAVAALVRAAELSGTEQARARRLAEAAYIGAEAGGVNDDAKTLLAHARKVSSDATRRAAPPDADLSTERSLSTAPGARTGTSDPAGSLHAANAAAFLMLDGDGDVHTAHRLLSGAIETGAHGYQADDPALIEAMHTLLLLSWWAGTPSHWDTFYRALQRLTPSPPDVLTVASKTFPDPVRTAAAAAPELDKLLAALSEHDNPARVVRIGTASVYLDRLSDLREASWRLVRQGRQGGSPRRQLGALMHLCLEDYLVGRWDEADELAREGHHICGTSGFAFFTWYFLYNRAIIAAGRGRTGEAHELADEITRWALPRGVTSAVLFAHHPRVLAASSQGDFEAAYLHAAAMSPAGTLASYLPHCTWVMFDLVEAALRTGRVKEALAHVAAMKANGVAELSPRMALIQAGAEALAVDDEPVAQRLEALLAVPAAERWLFEVSRIRLAFAEKLRRKRAPSEARGHLLAARDGFAALAATPWLARTEHELRATGHQPPGEAPGGRDTLTPQELEIAHLAASGLSNKQIAERLYLSPRTVGAHLYRIFPKLGVASRAGLRDALSRP